MAHFSFGRRPPLLGVRGQARQPLKAAYSLQAKQRPPKVVWRISASDAGRLSKKCGARQGSRLRQPLKAAAQGSVQPTREAASTQSGVAHFSFGRRPPLQGVRGLARRPSAFEALGPPHRRARAQVRLAGRLDRPLIQYLKTIVSKVCDRAVGRGEHGKWDMGLAKPRPRAGA